MLLLLGLWITGIIDLSRVLFTGGQVATWKLDGIISPLFYGETLVYDLGISAGMNSRAKDSSTGCNPQKPTVEEL